MKKEIVRFDVGGMLSRLDWSYAREYRAQSGRRMLDVAWELEKTNCYVNQGDSAIAAIAKQIAADVRKTVSVGRVECGLYGWGKVRKPKPVMEADKVVYSDMDLLRLKQLAALTKPFGAWSADRMTRYLSDFKFEVEA